MKNTHSTAALPRAVFYVLPVLAFLACVTVACLALAPAGCKTIGTPKAPPTVIAAIDCALPSLWAAVTVDAVERDVASAISQDNPIAALDLLAASVGEAEVTCVTAKINANMKLASSASTGPSVTQQWLDREAAKGLNVKNFASLAP